MPINQQLNTLQACRDDAFIKGMRHICSELKNNLYGKRASK